MSIFFVEPVKFKKQQFKYLDVTYIFNISLNLKQMVWL